MTKETPPNTLLTMSERRINLTCRSLNRAKKAEGRIWGASKEIHNSPLPKLDLTACMRKRLTILNTIVKHGTPWRVVASQLALFPRQLLTLNCDSWR
jgi:hypothetical protein